MEMNAAPWRSTLVGYVMGNKPFYLQMKGFSLCMWKPKYSLNVYSRANGFFFFKFGTEEECVRVLEGGPWVFDGRLVVLRRWSSCIGLDRDLLTKVPVWVRLPALNLKFWSADSIGKITSVIGHPLYMDAATARCDRLEFARVFVEVNATARLPSSVPIKLEDGTVEEQAVEYEWIPPICDNCRCFGHTIKQCPIRSVQEWRVKQGKASSAEPLGSALVIGEDNRNKETSCWGKAGPGTVVCKGWKH